MSPYLAERLIGDSPAVRELRADLPRLARSPVPVLIEGESGTGKSRLARMIHRLSPRSRHPFSVVDCAALSPGLLHGELFGHARGAFTGAEQARPGRLRAADGGTVLLAGVEHLDRRGQVALLRVLEEGEVQPLGESLPAAVDLRFIQTSQLPLGALAREGRFRPDLYYRLNGVTVTLPPLRERREDLAIHLEHQLQEESSTLGRAVPRLTRELRERLLQYEWPGNLRQLRHTLRGMLALLEGNTLGLENLPAELRRCRGQPDAPPATETFSIPGELPFHGQVETFQRALLLRSWRAAGHDRQRLLERLGLASHQLKYLLRKLNITLGP